MNNSPSASWNSSCCPINSAHYNSLTLLLKHVYFLQQIEWHWFLDEIYFTSPFLPIVFGCMHIGRWVSHVTRWEEKHWRGCVYPQSQQPSASRKINKQNISHLVRLTDLFSRMRVSSIRRPVFGFYKGFWDAPIMPWILPPPAPPSIAGERKFPRAVLAAIHASRDPKMCVNAKLSLCSKMIKTMIT